MISKAQIKKIRSLKRRQFRCKYQTFVAEGTKIILELLNTPEYIVKIYATNDWLLKYSELNKQFSDLIEVVDIKEIKQVSALKSPAEVLAVIRMPEDVFFDDKSMSNLNAPLLLLDKISDPGNLGTIIRTADWYGVKHIYLNKGCVDPFHPFSVQAAMGSVLRLKYRFCELEAVIESLVKLDYHCFAASLDGQNLHQFKLPQKSAFILGSESHGISQSVLGTGVEKISIPSFGLAESLNVAIAGGVILNHYRLSHLL